jgi:hypothetical protein
VHNLSTPILLLTFNRPDVTFRVMKEISRAKPALLFVASDGPRDNYPNDQHLVTETRRLVREQISWECEVQTLFHDTNLGLRRGVVEAIDWFFENVPQGIILEDDCVPHPDFFHYCEELLRRYRDDERVWAIQGDNSARARVSGRSSYGFVPHSLIWGWATWKRAWQHYDRDLVLWKSIRATRMTRLLWPDAIERKIRTEALDHLLLNPESTWDYQWGFTMNYHRGLATIPRVNLVSNIGWGRPDATHTKGSGLRQEAPTFSILPLKHPRKVARDRRASSDLLNGRTLGAGKFRFRFKVAKEFRRLVRRLARKFNAQEPRN